MTDEGFNLTNQWLAINGSEYYSYGAKWLSDLAGGAWLKIAGNLGLIGARLGWALMMGTTGLASFLILKRYFRPLASLLAVVFAGLAAMYHGTMTINYNNFPALLLIGATGLVLVSQERRTSRRRQTWLAILGGLLLGLGVMARFPLVLSLSLPFAPPIVRAMLTHRMPLKSSLIGAFVSLCSALLMILTCLAFLYLTNHLAEYWEAIIGALFGAPSGSSHAPANLLHLYIKTGTSAMLWGLKILLAGSAIGLGLIAGRRLIGLVGRKEARIRASGVILLLIGACLLIASFTVLTPIFLARNLSSDGILEDATLVRIQITRIGTTIGGGFLSALGVAALLFPCFVCRLADCFSKRRLDWSWIPVILFGFLFLGLVQQLAGSRGTYSLVLLGTCFVLASLQLLSSLLSPRCLTTHETDKLVLLAMGLLIALLKLLGSNNGVSSAKDAIWLLFPVAFLLVPESVGFSFRFLSSRIPRDPRSKQDVNTHTIKRFAVAAMVALSLVGLSIRAENPYRDLTDRFQLTTQLQHERLRGIFTSSGRAESVNQLLDELDQLVEPGDVVLAYSAIPMIHYVTQTIPALRNPWPTLMQPTGLEERLRVLMGSESLPQVVIRANTDTANRIWGTRAIAPPQVPGRRGEDIYILDEWLQSQGYREVWTNRDFAIYQP